MAYTTVFGGNTIYPSDVSYLPLALTADVSLEWPLENSGAEFPAARIIDVTPDAAGWDIRMPSAVQTGAGQSVLFNNRGADSFFVKDYDGNTLATVASGELWQVYLTDTSTAAGAWQVFRYGASTATVQPSALAGYGLTVTGSTLSQSHPVTTFSMTGLTLSDSNRADFWVWDGTGTGTLNLPTATTVGDDYFVVVRNSGGGDLTLDPSGAELINGASTLALRPGDSAILITNGSAWYTVGLGQEAVFAFDYTSIALTGGTYTLTGSELNRISYKFTGVLASDVTVVVPATIQQYWINNATTGSFDFFIKATGGPTTQVNQGAKGIYYCDGVNMVLASDPTALSVPVVISDGGTGATTASGARLNLGITPFADAIVTATTGATVRTTIDAAKNGANNDITSLSGLTTALSIAQGGTGATTAAGARTNFGLGTMAVQNSNSVSITGGSLTGVSLSALASALAVADGGTGATTAAGARTNLGLGTIATQNANNVTITGGSISGTPFSGGSVSATTVSGLTSPLAILDGGTGATTDAGARTNLGLGTMATQSAASVAITGGSITGITDLAIADGGTGASTAANARTNLGLGALAVLSTINNSNWSGTALAVGNGGTGVTTLLALLAALGFATSESGAKGYVDIPIASGKTLRLNWGADSVANNTAVSVNLHGSYSTALVGGVIGVVSSDTSLNDNIYGYLQSTTQIRLTNGNDGSSYTLQWLALGWA